MSPTVTAPGKLNTFLKRPAYSLRILSPSLKDNRRRGLCTGMHSLAAGCRVAPPLKRQRKHAIMSWKTCCYRGSPAGRSSLSVRVRFIHAGTAQRWRHGHGRSRHHGDSGAMGSSSCFATPEKKPRCMLLSRSCTLSLLCLLHEKSVREY